MAEPSFLTISQLADELNLHQHILRYWETRFPQLRPLTRAGNRRYYRPEDAELVRQLNHLLNVQGYTVKGVQKLLASGGKATMPVPAQSLQVPAPSAPATPSASLLSQLEMLRGTLMAALDADDRAALST